LALYLVPEYPTRLYAFLALITVQFLLYGLAVRLVLQGKIQREVTIAILFLSLLFHLTLLPSRLIFEDDIYRYIWDGKMLINAVNPFQYPPDANALQSLRDAHIWPLINYKHVPTIYPPFAQALFALAYRLFPESVVGMKFLIITVNFILILFLCRLLRAMGISRNRVLIYAWNPLVLKEIANSGHMDPLPACLLLGSILMLLYKRRFAAILLYGLSFLSKFYPALLLPLYWKRTGWRGIFLFSFLILIFYLPFLGNTDGTLVFKGLAAFAGRWLFNPGLYSLTWGLASSFTAHPALAAKILHGLVLLGVIGYTYWKDDKSPARLLWSAFVIFGALILLSPVVNVWYLICLIPFLCFFPSPPWLLFTFLVFAGYGFFLEYRDIPWVRLTEYGIFYLALGVQLCRKNFVTIYRRISEKL